MKVKHAFKKKKKPKKINIHSNREVNNDKIKCENMIDWINRNKNESLISVVFT